MCVNVPLVPWMVRVNVPVCELRFVLTVSVDEPEVEMDAGLKLALVRRGSPETLRPTLPEKPLTGVIMTVYFTLELPATVALDGAAEMEKSALIALTTSVTPAVWFKAPLVAVMVSG